MAEIVPTAALSIDLPWLARHGQGYQNALGEIHLTLPERLPHVERDDTVTHICKSGERLQDIAVYHYKETYSNAVDMWEIIAQFQEDPIVDGSLLMEAERVLLIPSPEYILEVALGDPLHEYPRL